MCDHRGYENRNEKYPARETYKGVTIQRVFSTGFGKGHPAARLVDFLSFDLFLFLKLLRMPPFDVVISFTSPPMLGFLGALFCRWRGGRVIQWLMDVNPDTAIRVGYVKEGSWLANGLNALFRMTLEASDLVVVLDRWMKQTVLSKGISPSRVIIVPPWSVVPTENIPPLSRDTGFRKKYGLENKFILLYSGNHSLVHPLDTILEAAVHLKDRTDVHFVFCGGGVRVADVRRVVAENNLKNVLQISAQSRESYRDLLLSADLHAIVMGNAMSGLSHLSKLYGILWTGRPYVFIGPSESHVGDTLRASPFGFRVSHGDVPDLLTVISLVKDFSDQDRERYREGNTRYLKTTFQTSRALEELYLLLSAEDLRREPAKLTG